MITWKCFDSGNRQRKTRTVTLSRPPSDLADGVRRRGVGAVERRRGQRRQRREVALVAVDVVGDQATGVIEQPADHDQQDQDEDQDALPVRGIAIALLGAAETEQARDVEHEPPVEHVGDADDHAGLEQITSEEDGGPSGSSAANPGDAPVSVERPTNRVITWSSRTTKPQKTTACAMPDGCSPARNFFWPNP